MIYENIKLDDIHGRRKRRRRISRDNINKEMKKKELVENLLTYMKKNWETSKNVVTDTYIKQEEAEEKNSLECNRQWIMLKAEEKAGGECEAVDFTEMEA